MIIKPGCKSINNHALLTGLLANQDNPAVRRTHRFEGRYENIYLTENEVPELAALTSCALDYAKGIVDQPITETGCWFNAMPPGSRTTRHDHNDGAELLSGVYYVAVPEQSGNLLIHQNGEVISHSPQVGQFVFFLPQVVHEVEVNQSEQMRLSIAFNFLGELED